MSHTAGNLSPEQSPSSAETLSSAVTPAANSADTSLSANGSSQQYSNSNSISNQQQYHQHSQQGASYSDTAAYSQSQHQQYSQHPQSSSAFAPTTPSASSQQQQQQYQASPHNHTTSAAQYVSHDQQSALAPLQFGHLGVIGHQRSSTGFPYDFDPNDSSCRNMYSTADIDPTNPTQPMPQQLTTAGYIRHGGGIPVSAAQHQQQQGLDMTAAGISLPVDISGDQAMQSQQQHSASHMHIQQQQQPALHASNPQSPFGNSSVGTQPIFSTLSFQSSQMQDYDSYGRQPKQRTNRVTKPKRTPRPPNAFILYRKAKQAEVIRDNPGVSNKDVSCIIGQMWKAEDPAVQDKYREQAEVEKKKHKEMHPNYKYQPRKPKNKRLQESQIPGGAGGSLVPGSTAAAVAAAVAGSASGQDGAFSNGIAGTLPSVLKDPNASMSGAGFQPYSKYHLMMQPGHGQLSQQSAQTSQSQQQTPQQQQHQQPPHSQTPVSQQQVSRGDDYYYRSSGGMSDHHHQQSQQQHAHANGGFVGVPPQLDIKPGFVNGISAAAYWTPATPSDAAFSNTLPSGNVFHGGDQTAAASAIAAAANMRPFDSVVPQHAAATTGSTGHAMSANSTHMFHAFDHQQRQSQQQHHHQQQHDVHGHVDYQNGQQQYHQQQQHHGHAQQQHQGAAHPASMLGSYVNGSQAYHHSQQGMDGLDGSSVAAADSQGLGLLSPPAVAWSTNM
ncbi:hypothetical protein GGI25_002732 [Coemansia spiralis]|uniref:HMG box domain-containing protein n=2 Tax=Coemansia TaxID=4863 RepID=A0A9W8G9Y5_9FUNG|nr:hypothetical protein EDC05_002147 [Coemansia umbellata]KAJ2625236.1 hypothetical protein GGI26_000706 [Coemansia sp. RSA 1358]KAJ2677942.1 hypothetical protein GGI25_002732 [Coemansia spiralis]